MTSYGLDIGTTAIHAVKLRKARDGTVSLLGGLSVPMRDLVPGEERQAALALLRELKAANWSIGAARLGVSGHESTVRYTHMPVVPPWRLKLVMSYEIEEVAQKAGEPISADYRILNVPHATHDQLTLLVAMVKDRAVSGRIDALASAGMKVRGLLPNAIALFDAHRGLGMLDQAQTAMFLDVGDQNTDIAIHHQGFLIFARSVPNGAGAWLDRLAQSLKVSRADAEVLLDEPGERAEEVKKALRPAYNQALQLVRQSMQFCQSQVRAEGTELDEVRVSGLGAKAFGLCEHLAEGLQIPAAVADPFEAADTSALPATDRAYLASRASELMIAIGLALADEDDGRGSVNLDILPAIHRARRQFRERTVFAALSGVLVLLFLVVGLVLAHSQKGDRKARYDLLAEQVETLGGWASEQARLEKENATMQGLLTEVSRRTLPGYHALRLLSVIPERLPPTLAITAVAYEPPDPKATGEAPPPAGTLYRVAGELDNANGDGNEVLSGFRGALLEIPEVEGVDVLFTRERLQGTFLDFSLRVRCR